MAVAQGSGTGGPTKKKPDDPYFDSESPAGSNFKQAKGTSSSTGFKDKQATADPYFSNTSPAGSTMSSDKSTWRSTNSGWNVPPSGGTAAQGGGTYNRSPNTGPADPYFNERSPAGSRSGSTVRSSKRGDNAPPSTPYAPDYEGYRNISTVRDTSGGMAVRWTSPLFSDTAEGATINRDVWQATKNAWTQDKDWASQYVDWIQEQPAVLPNDGANAPFTQWLLDNTQAGAYYTVGHAERWGDNSQVAQIEQQLESVDAQLNRLRGEVPLQEQLAYGAQGRTNSQYLTAEEAAIAQEEARKNIATAAQRRNTNALIAMDERGAIDYTNRNPDILTSFDPGSTAEQNMAALGLLQGGSHLPGDPNEIQVPYTVSRDERIAQLEAERTRLQSALVVAKGTRPLVEVASMFEATQKGAVQDLFTLPMTGQLGIETDQEISDYLKSINIDPTAANIESFRNSNISVAEATNIFGATVNSYNPGSNAYIGAPWGREKNFIDQVNARTAELVRIKLQVDQLPPDEQFLARATIGGLAFTESSRWAKPIDEIVNYDSLRQAQLTNIRNFSDVLNDPYSSYDQKQIAALQLAQSGRELNRLENKSVTADVQENMTVSSELLWSLFVPDPTDFVLNPLARAIGAGWKKMIRTGAPELTDEVVEAALKEAVGTKADDLAAKIAADTAAGGTTADTVRGGTNWLKGILRRTPSTEVELIRQSFWDTTGIILNSAQTTQEARALLKGMFDGTLLNASARVGRNTLSDPLFVNNLALYKQFEKELLNATSLADNVPFNASVVQGEMDDILNRNVTQLFGLSAQGVPAGTLRVKEVKVKNKKWALEYYGADGKLLYTSDPSYSNKAAAIAAREEHQKIIKDFASNNKAWLHVANGDFARHLLSSTYLGTPRNVIRNAINGNATMYFEDGVVLANKGHIERTLKRHYNGSLPFEVDQALTGGAINPEISQSSFYDLGGRWKPRNAGGKVPNPMAGFDLKMREVAYGGSAEIPIAPGKSIGVSEGVLRSKAFYSKWDETLYRGAKNLKRTLSSALEDMGLDPNIASPIVNEFHDAVLEGGRNNILDRVRKLVRKDVLPVNLRELGIEPHMLHGESGARLVDMIQNTDMADPVARKTALLDWIASVEDDLGTELTSSKPQPGNFVDTKARQAQHGAWVADTLEDALIKSGVDKKTARVQARQLASEVIRAEQSAWDTVRAVAASLQNEDAIAVNLSFWRKAESELEKLYTELDELRSTYHQIKAAAGKKAVETTQAWDRYAKRQVQMWQDYRQNIKTFSDDIVAATIELEPRQTLREALQARGVDQDTIDSLTRIDVGDKVVLGDTLLPEGGQATSHTVKQVLQENDLTSYVVVDANGIERTVKQADIADNVTKLELADSIAAMAVAEGDVIEGLDNADTLIARLTQENQEYIAGTQAKVSAFDPAENSVIRAKGAAGDDDTEWWNTYINAGRDYMNQGKREAVLAYSINPTQEFTDALLAAENDVLDVGRVVKRQHDILRQDLLEGKISRAKYDLESQKLWGSYYEYGHQRYRYAKIQGLRGADDATVQQVMRSESGKYFVPPYLEADDIRRVASLTERASDKGDKRLLNSIKSHLKIEAKSLDELSVADRQKVFKYYLDEAEKNGVDVAREWYKYRTPNLSDFTDFTDAENFFDAQFRTEMLLKSTGGAQAPSVDDYVRTSLRHAYDAAEKVEANADKIAAGRPNVLTPKQQQEIVSIVARMASGYDDVLYDAERAGREYMNRIMLNYRNRRGFDDALKVLFPFHYFWSRSLVEWSKRIMRKPSVAYDLWLIDRAVQLDSQQYDGPTRTQNSVPNVLKTLATNLNAPDMVTNLLPDRLYNPAAYAIPYNPLNDFVDPSKANNDYELAWRYGQRVLPGFQPYINYGVDLAFDQYAPIQNGWKRIDDYELGDYIPPYRVAGYGAMAITGDVRYALGGNFLTNSMTGNGSAPGYGPNFMNAGDVYVVGLVGRALRNDIIAGDITGNDADLAMAWLSTMQAGAPIPPELMARQKDIAPIILQAAKDAGYEKTATQAVSLIFGLSGQMQPVEEAQIRELNKIRGELGYSYENPWGSQMAQEAYDLMATTDANVQLGEARKGNNYWELYNPPQMVPQPPDSSEKPMTVQTLSALRQSKWDETSAVYDAMNQASVDFILDNRATMSRQELLDGVRDIESTYRDQLKQIDAAYPSVPLGRKRGQAYTYGANPFETAHAELLNVLAYEPPGKPEWPGSDATPKQKYDYYVAKGDWDDKRANVIERVATQLAMQDGPTPSDADNAMARQLIGRTVQELIDSYAFRNSPAEVIDLEMQDRAYDNAKYNESLNSVYQRVEHQFGNDGLDLMLAYDALPGITQEDRDKGVYFTEEQNAFRDKNPEIDEIRYFKNYPDEYQEAIDLFGDDIFELSGTFPGGGSKAERKRWYNSHTQRDIDRTKAFWSFKDDVQAKYDYRYTPEYDAELERLAQSWMTQPPTGDPIGINPNQDATMYSYPFDNIGANKGGLGDYLPLVRYPNGEYNPVRSRAEYEALTQGTPDLTGLPPQQRLEEAAFNQANPPAPTDLYTYGNAEAGGGPKAIAQSTPGLQWGLPGVTSPGPSTVMQLPQIQEAIRTGTLNVLLDSSKAESASNKSERPQFAFGYGGGYSGYRYRGRYYRSRRSRGYRRSYSRRRSGGYRSYSRGGRRGGYGGGYGGGGGYSTAEEQQPLYLRFDGPQQTYAREFATWLYPQSNNQTWRPAGINSGFTPPRGNVAIRPWRRINVRA